MTILIAPDKFKGSLSAKEVCRAIAGGLSGLKPPAIIQSVPLADGGEGTCDLLTEWANGTFVEVTVPGPLFSPVSARYGISKDGDTAFIEMAVASGLTLLKSEQRNPLLTTTLGTGELIRDAIKRNVKKIILGLGGSATIDAGTGMAAALGYGFSDATGDPLAPTGENLIHIRAISTEKVPAALNDIEFIALCDVTNPLFGPDGAAYVYGPQKGAGPQALELLDAGLRNFRRMAHNQLKKNSVDFPGAGAAGGLGAGAKVFLGAKVARGVTYIMETAHLEEKIQQADLVITGEGKIDSQTFCGKVVSEVAAMAIKAGKPVVAVCGRCELPKEELQSHGIRNVIALVDEETSAESATVNAAALISARIREEFKDAKTL